MDGEPSFGRNKWRDQRLRAAELILALELDDHAVAEGFLAKISDSRLCGKTMGGSVIRCTCADQATA